LRKLTKGLQNWLLLEDGEGNVEILLTVRFGLVGKRLKGSPFESDALPMHACTKKLTTQEDTLEDSPKYLIYPVHNSGAYVLMASNVHRLYLLRARLWAHQYEEASRYVLPLCHLI
jgi:hypothetical protein